LRIRFVWPVLREPRFIGAQRCAILEVLQIVANTVGNTVMEKAIRQGAGDIERGESMSTALGKHRFSLR